MKSLIKKSAKRLPFMREVVSERDRLREEVRDAHATCESLSTEKSELESEIAKKESEIARREQVERELREEIARLKTQTWAPPGHFYSPIPDAAEIERNRDRIWRKPLPLRELPGIELREAAQLEAFHELAAFYDEIPFTPLKDARLRYYFENDNFSYSDAIFLFCMVRRWRPRRIIEIGSGYSSCVMLDTNELFFDNQISLTFIEPHTERLFSLIRDDDRRTMNLVEEKVQDVDLEMFAQLAPGDFLFVDSTHVAKTLSDVNRILFEILPLLQSGVFIHFHDIFYPFVYPLDWELEGRAWNEAYALRAFLQYNDSFEIYLCNTFLEYFHEPLILEKMPLCMKNTGCSLWLRKL